MDLESITLSEIIQMERDKYCMISLICDKHTKQNKGTSQNKQKQRHREQSSGYQRRRGRGGNAKWVMGINCLVTDEN